ncbi:MAG: RNA 2'-phosphotransferase [Desulfurococcales archaeon]|nr:RNA 2'-phosphotransferase [Desulfurococcales archaeon]
MPWRDARERVEISKKLAGLLRHYGEKYGVRVDGEGWARIEDVVEALKRMGFHVTIDDIISLAAEDEKGRYEVRGDKIRARYGHSVRVSIRYEESWDVEKLYHGTPLRNLRSIMERGLLPGKRLYVHLTPDPKTALETGRRYGRPVALLEVDVRCLRRSGRRLYKATSVVYLTDSVPPDCIRVVGVY